MAVSSVVPETSVPNADSMRVMFDSDLPTGASPRATETTMRGAPAPVWLIDSMSGFGVEKAVPVAMEVTDSEPAGWTETSTPIGLPSWKCRAPSSPLQTISQSIDGGDRERIRHTNQPPIQSKALMLTATRQARRRMTRSHLGPAGSISSRTTRAFG